MDDRRRIVSFARVGRLHERRRYETFLKKGIPFFDTLVGFDQEDEELLEAISDATAARSESANILVQTFGPETDPVTLLREQSIVMVASVLWMNAMDWLVLDHAGRASVADHASIPHHIVASLHPLHWDVARKAQALGVRVETRSLHEDSFDETEELFEVTSIMASGKFDPTAL